MYTSISVVFCLLASTEGGIIPEQHHAMPEVPVSSVGTNIRAVRQVDIKPVNSNSSFNYPTLDETYDDSDYAQSFVDSKEKSVVDSDHKESAVDSDGEESAVNSEDKETINDLKTDETVFSEDIQTINDSTNEDNADEDTSEDSQEEIFDYLDSEDTFQMPLKTSAKSEQNNFRTQQREAFEKSHVLDVEAPFN